MKKFYVGNINELNEEEKRTGKISYGKLINRYINNLVLCNNIVNVDNSIFDNMVNIEDDEEEETEIYQYYLCNLNDYERETLIECGISLSYSDLLECDVLLVTHYGTSWDYVMTDVEWSENYEEC